MLVSFSYVLRTDLNNSEIRYTKKLFRYVFSWQGVCTHPTHLVCLCHCFLQRKRFRLLLPSSR